jgi:hypothetical protein
LPRRNAGSSLGSAVRRAVCLVAPTAIRSLKGNRALSRKAKDCLSVH